MTSAVEPSNVATLPIASTPTKTRRRLGSTHVLLAVVGLCAFGLNVLALQGWIDPQRAYLVARDVAAGETWAEDDFVQFELRTPEQSVNVLSREEVAGLIGTTALRDVPEGSLASSDLLAGNTPVAASRRFALPLPDHLAATGALGVGDTIDVLRTGLAEPTWILQGARVVGSAGGSSGGGLLAGNSSQTILIEVEPNEAVTLAEGLEQDALTIVLSTGAAPPEEPPTAGA